MTLSLITFHNLFVIKISAYSKVFSYPSKTKKKNYTSVTELNSPNTVLKLPKYCLHLISISNQFRHCNINSFNHVHFRGAEFPASVCCPGLFWRRKPLERGLPSSRHYSGKGIMDSILIGLDIGERGRYTDCGVSGYSLAVTLSRKLSMSDEFVKKMGEEMMLSIAGKCKELGARSIGHIKSHMSTTAGTIRADTIGVSHGAYSAGCLAYPVKDISMAISCVVQGIFEEAVKAATLEGLLEVAEMQGISVVKEKEHSYFDEFDYMATRQEFIRQLEEQLNEYDWEDDV